MKTTKETKVTKKTKKTEGLSAQVLGLDGKKKGSMILPDEIFGQKPNKQLLAQAVRVYLANQREGSASTKTRGEVEGSTRKIYKQKGTGKARHGSIRAHIFVGGGIVFGPVPHEFTLDFPKKMKRKALAAALSQQFQAGNVLIVDGLETVKKTKTMFQALSAVGATRGVLLVLSERFDDTLRFTRNIEGVDVLPGNSLNTYTVLSHQKIVFMKDAIKQITV